MKRPFEQKLDHIIGRMQADMSVDAPAEDLTFVKSAFRSRAHVSRPSLRQRMLAVLKTDLAPNRAAFGERSANGAESRQMLFDAGDNAVDLRITPLEEMFVIRGQILGSGFESGEVTIKGSGLERSSSIDEMGGFRFEGLPAGNYSLTAISDTCEIKIDELTIG